MRPLPPPHTFEQGQRWLFGVAAGLAGLSCGIAVLVAASIITFGDWGAAQIRLQLYILAGCAVVGSINTTIVIIGFLLGGPVGRISVKASKDGAEIDASGNGQ